MGDHFSFKWTDFRSSLTQGFHDFLQEEMMVDVTLAAEGKFIQAHKLVLSVCSPYFKTLFKVNPCKHPIVILQDIGHSELSYMLEFMYKGEVGVRHENLKAFLKLAETLKVRGLEGKNFQIDEYPNKVARVKKKIDKNEVSKDSPHSELLNNDSEKKMMRKRKRRLSKLNSVKKLKSENSENVSVSISAENNSTCVSEDEDDNPLISLIRGEKVKSGENSRHSDSEAKNNMSFSDWDDGVGPSDYSENAEDFEAFFPTVHTEDSEQAPQGGVDYQMIQTKRGKDMLLFGGYTFTQNRMCKDGMRFQCSYPKCKAFCRMSSAGWLTPYKTHHDHPKPSEQEIRKRILRMELKARAQSSCATPGEILRNAISADEYHGNERACFTRCIQRFRKSLQKKNSKPQQESWQDAGENQTEKNSPKRKPPDGGDWLSHPQVPDPMKNEVGWHAHSESINLEDEKQLMGSKGIIQRKVEPFGL